MLAHPLVPRSCHLCQSGLALHQAQCHRALLGRGAAAPQGGWAREAGVVGGRRDRICYYVLLLFFIEVKKLKTVKGFLKLVGQNSEVASEVSREDAGCVPWLC